MHNDVCAESIILETKNILEEKRRYIVRTNFAILFVNSFKMNFPSLNVIAKFFASV